MSDNLSVTMTESPLSIQGKILKEFQARQGLSDGDIIVDANNVFSFGLEAFSTITASALGRMGNGFNSLYGKRAITSEDLYKHMSTFDYVGLFSSPVPTTVNLIMDKNYLIENALDENYGRNDGSAAYYKELVIPKNTVFRIAQYTFGIYYPIHIRINKQSNSFIVVYNTENENPLQSLSSNTLNYVTTSASAVELMILTVPIYQFARELHEETVVANNGFTKVYSFEDKFYAARIFYTKPVPNGTVSADEWLEMEQTLSDDIYDSETPTAKLMVATDTNQLKVTVPQTYFTNNRIGTKIRVEIYTSKGYVDAEIGNVDTNDFDVSFVSDPGEEISPFTVPLTKIPNLQMVPTTTRLQGGTNGYGFEELRNRVLNNSFKQRTPITPAQLKSFFYDLGFDLSTYRDGITDREYLASNALVDNTNVVITAAEAHTNFSLSSLQAFSQEDKATILNPEPGIFIVKPTTLYKYDYATATTVPLARETYNLLTNGKSNAEIAATFNKDTYTYSPFFIRLDANERYPKATCFDISMPTLSDVTFVQENRYISQQLTIFTSYIENIADDAGGFRIFVSTMLSEDLRAALEEAGANGGVSPSGKDLVRAVLFLEDDAGHPIYLIGTTSAVQVGGKPNERVNFWFEISTTYSLKDNATIDVTNFTDGDVVTASKRINLESKAHLYFFMNDTLFGEDGAPQLSNIVPPIEVVWRTQSGTAVESFTPTTVQSVKINLGYVVMSLRTGVHVSYSPLEYASYTTTAFSTYEFDRYKMQNNQFVVDGGRLVIDHYEGEVITPPQMKITAPSAELFQQTYRMIHPVAYPSTYAMWYAIPVGGVDHRDLRVEVMDALEYILNVIDTSYTTTTTAASGRRKARTVTHNYLMCKNYDELLTLSDIEMFAYVSDISYNGNAESHGDQSEAECYIEGLSVDPAEIEVGNQTGALYRRDPITRNWIKIIEVPPDDVGYDALKAYLGVSRHGKCGTMYVMRNAHTIYYIHLLSFVRDAHNNYKFSIERRNEMDYDFAEVDMGADTDAEIPTEEATHRGVRYISTQSFKLYLPDPNQATDDKFTYHLGDRIELLQKELGVDGKRGEVLVKDAEGNSSHLEWTDVSEDGAGTIHPRLYIYEIVDDHLVLADGSVQEHRKWQKVDVWTGVDQWPWECQNWISVTNDLAQSTDLGNDPQIVRQKLVELRNILNLARVSTIPSYNSVDAVPTGDANTYYWVTNIVGNEVIPEIIALPRPENWYGCLYKRTGDTKVEPTAVVPLVLAETYSKLLEWLESSVGGLAEFDETFKAELLDTSYRTTIVKGEEVEVSIPVAIKARRGSMLVDEYGNPVLDPDKLQRDPQFVVDMIHVDAKLRFSNRPEHADYIRDMQELLRNHFTVLDTAKEELLEVTKLYYQPIRSLGMAEFKRNNNEYITLTLELTVKLRLYVSEFMMENTSLQELIREGILELIDEAIATGTFSCTEVATKIKQTMSDNISYVDVLGINDMTDLQTLICMDTNARPHLKQVLTVLTDGTLSVGRGLELEFVAI